MLFNSITQVPIVEWRFLLALEIYFCGKSRYSENALSYWMIQRHSATLNKHLLISHSIRYCIQNRKTKVEKPPWLSWKSPSGVGDRHTNTVSQEQYQVPEKPYWNIHAYGLFLFLWNSQVKLTWQLSNKTEWIFDYTILNKQMSAFNKCRNNLIVVWIVLRYQMCSLDAVKYLSKDEFIKMPGISVSAQK